MGNLWNNVHDFFDTADGTYPEICICHLSRESISESYNFIRKNSSTVRGQHFISRETNECVELGEVENAADLVCDGKAQPFHFIVRNLQLTRRSYLRELGVFILDNAIALDYEKSQLWGEAEIFMLFKLMMQIMEKSPDSFLRLEDRVSKDDKDRFFTTFAGFVDEQKQNA